MRILFILSALAFLCACSNQDTDKDVVTEDTLLHEPESTSPGIEDHIQFKNLVWLPVFDSAKGAVVLKQQRQVDKDTLTAEKLIKEINDSWDGINLEFLKISHDTIYVAIPESSVLTQQMGSSGAYSYISSTTYILTELKSIKFVDFDFVEGDHLAPGTMKRSDFQN